MSGGAVFQEALRMLGRQSLPEVSQADLVAALKAGRPGPLEFLYEIGAEAGLPPDTILARSVASYFNFCAGNLCDDLSDSECSYLPDPDRLGPCTQLTLQNLFFHALLEADLPSKTISVVVKDLIEAVGPRHLELRTKHWTAPLFREVAEGIAGRQWSAYFQIMWCGTKLAVQAATIGMNTGIAAHIAKDIRSLDPRYTTMSEGDKQEIVIWGKRAAQALRGEHLRSLQAMLMTIDPILQKAM